MIKKENKLIQITLDPENLELLNSLALRFHNSKTDVIKQALRLYAADKNHHYKVYLTSKECKKEEDDFLEDDGRTLKDLEKEFKKNNKKKRNK